ncbi:MAG: hypothetical protein ACNA7W_09855 [Pseudomonadales bacterium]
MNSKNEDLLKAALAAEPVPEPSDGFVDRVLASAVAAQPRRRWRARWVAAAGVAMAASVALAVTAILTVTMGLRDAVPVETLQASHHGEPRIINVVISATDRRQDATLTIRLAEDLELDGYAGLNLIQWQTDLEQGRNLLALPVRSKTGSGGEIWIALAYNGAAEKEMRIVVDAG